MVYSETKEIVRAKNLMQEGKFGEALQLINKFEKKENHLLLDLISCYNLKSSLFYRMEKKEEFFTYAEKAYMASQGQIPSLQLLDAYTGQIHKYLWDLKYEEAHDLLVKCEDLFNTLIQEPSLEITKRKADIAWNKSALYEIKGDNEKALDCARNSLVMREDLNLRADMYSSLNQLKELYYKQGDFDRTLKFAVRCLTHAIDMEHKNGILYSYITIGLVYAAKGELEGASEQYNKGLIIARELGNIFGVAAILNNLGLVQQQQGKWDLAQENFENSFKYFQEAGSIGHTTLDSLFHLALDKGDLEMAKQHLDHLEELKSQYDRKVIDLIYRVDKAVLLKTSPRALNRGKAEEMLKHIIAEEKVYYDVIIMALLNLCDLLVFDLRATGMLEIIDELNSYIVKLINMAEKNHSFLILAETYLLQARLALLKLNLKESRLLLTKSQNIAEKYGLSRLAIKISSEHDAFLKQQNVWENMNGDEVSLVERIELSGINQQMDDMLRRKEIEFPKVSDEDPVIILIISESGEPIFSQSFTEKWSFENDVFGSFLSAINSFSDEMFSEGLDRANFGQYSILMKSVPPFLVCYLFLGQSYLAQHRISYFIERIQNDHIIWETFNKFYQTNQVIESKDVPSLEPLITEIFINRSIPQMN